MGAAASVRLANIYMHVFLTKFFNQYRLEKPLKLGRLIDDLFFIWYGTEESLQQFYTDINSYHCSIKFELTFSRTEINFLDTTIYIENNNIYTRLYRKPTDKKEYLHYSSNHPHHMKKAIIYSQALRYRRIIDYDAVLRS